MFDIYQNFWMNLMQISKYNKMNKYNRLKETVLTPNDFKYD